MLDQCSTKHGGFCKPCYQHYFENEIGMLQKVTMKCPLETCENIASKDDVEDAVSEATFLVYQKLVKSQNSCL